MAWLLIPNQSLAFSLPATPARASFKTLHLPTSPALRFSGDPFRRKTRGLKFVARAGPSASSYVFAFVLPLSLLVITIFTALKIDDKLDRDFLEELAMNEAIMEGDEEEEDNEDFGNSFEEKPAFRTRNRPKRED